jgi:hypothetical protein
MILNNCAFPMYFRIGTILEMVRTIAVKLVEQNLRVRVCVQQSMGVGIFTGMPKALGGVLKLLQMMDWQSQEGEENEGMVGDYVNFGNIGAQHVVDAHVREDGTKVEQDDVFILIAPQSMIGVDSSIMGPLKEMVEAVGDRPIILLNSDLIDKVSPQGQQNVRGRQVSTRLPIVEIEASLIVCVMANISFFCHACLRKNCKRIGSILPIRSKPYGTSRTFTFREPPTFQYWGPSSNLDRSTCGRPFSAGISPTTREKCTFRYCPEKESPRGTRFWNPSKTKTQDGNTRVISLPGMHTMHEDMQ